MREVKFKAYDKVSKKVRDVLYIQWTSAGIRFVDMIGARRQSQSIVLMEYTGLKDRNGVEIYEGHIIQKTNSQTGFKTAKASIAYNPFSARFTGLSFGTSINMEVIGCIYENPELIK